MKYALNKDRDAELACLAMRCVGSHVPADTTWEYWVLQRRLVQHADGCLATVMVEGMRITNVDA
jgi:hypothetical protein